MKFPFWKIGAALMAMMPTQLDSPLYNRRNYARGRGRFRKRGSLAARSLRELAARNRANGVKCAVTKGNL